MSCAAKIRLISVIRGPKRRLLFIVFGVTSVKSFYNQCNGNVVRSQNLFNPLSMLNSKYYMTIIFNIMLKIYIPVCKLACF
jgi:hypothetical protein